MTSKIVQVDSLRSGMPALRNWDWPLRMFYDETNNIRRLSLSETGLNDPADRTFAIAGIALRPGQSITGWDGVRAALNIQANAPEVKFKHITGKGYEGALDSQRLSVVLSWLLESDLLIHYSVLDMLYWSIIDIAESLMADERLSIIPIHLPLKNELYHAVRVDPPAFMALLERFAYPDVERSQVKTFLEGVLEYVEQHMPDDRNQFTRVLKQTLRQAARLPGLELPFLHENERGELIGGFSTNFMHCIYIFKHASHVFDREKHVEKALESIEIYDGEERLDYRFSDSKSEIGIQISDVLVGLLGRHFTFLRDHTLPELRAKKAGFSERQLQNLGLLRALIDKSDAFSDGLFHAVLPLDTGFKNDVFLHAAQAPYFMS